MDLNLVSEFGFIRSEGLSVSGCEVNVVAGLECLLRWYVCRK